MNDIYSDDSRQLAKYRFKNYPLISHAHINICVYIMIDQWSDDCIYKKLTANKHH